MLPVHEFRYHLAMEAPHTTNMAPRKIGHRADAAIAGDLTRR
jgi:hypothetical protein